MNTFVPELRLLAIASKKGYQTVDRLGIICDFRQAKRISLSRAASFVDRFFTTRGWAVTSNGKHFWINF